MDLPGRRARIPVPSTGVVDGGIARGQTRPMHLGMWVPSGPGSGILFWGSGD